MPEQCPYIEKCQTTMDKKSGEGSSSFPKLFQMHFCQSCFHACARYFIIKKKGFAAVPRDLLPVDMERVTHLKEQPKPSNK